MADNGMYQPPRENYACIYVFCSIVFLFIIILNTELVFAKAWDETVMEALNESTKTTAADV